jgi:hypothetical protein
VAAAAASKEEEESFESLSFHLFAPASIVEAIKQGKVTVDCRRCSFDCMRMS